MDLIGEIVEHDIEAPEPPKYVEATGFPSTKEFRKPKTSRWKQRQQVEKKAKDENKNEKLSEAEKIHRENIEKMSKMTEEEILQEKQELLQGLDANLIKSLLQRTEKRLSSKVKTDNESTKIEERPEENYKGWFGNARTESGWKDLTQLDSEDVDKALGIQNLDVNDFSDSEESRKKHADNNKKTVRFSEINEEKVLGYPEDLKGNDIIKDNDGDESENEVAPDDYQIISEDSPDKFTVHFPKPPQHDDLDLDDPEFYNKLHEKYFPDLPKETKKLAWMSDPMPIRTSSTYESISDMRFDFSGDLLKQDKNSEKLPTYMGLHHHSDDPHLPGYTLPELAHLARSSLPGQRCISIRTLGRILHKLGLGMYNILPIVDDEDYKNDEENKDDLKDDFEKLMWDLIEKLRVIETLTEASDESKTSNLSVRNYAIEALWLWKQGENKV